MQNYPVDKELIYWILFSENISERFYVALYKKLSDPALKSSSKHAMFLNLLYKSLIKDISERRVKVCLTHRGTKIFKYCTCPAGWVTYNFHSSCKHMHLSFKSVCKEQYVFLK